MAVGRAGRCPTRCYGRDAVTATRYTLAEMEAIAEKHNLAIEYRPPSTTFSQWHVVLTNKTTREDYYSTYGSWGDGKRGALDSALRWFHFIRRRSPKEAMP